MGHGGPGRMKALPSDFPSSPALSGSGLPHQCQLQSHLGVNVLPWGEWPWAQTRALLVRKMVGVGAQGEPAGSADTRKADRPLEEEVKILEEISKQLEISRGCKKQGGTQKVCKKP